MPGACAALLASVALGASGLRYEVGASASYTAEWESLAPSRGTRIELVPRLRLTYGERSFDLGVAYDPQVLSGGSWPPSLLHRAAITLDLRAARGLRLAALASASYGTYSFRYQPVALPPAPTGTPGTTPGGPEPPAPPPPPATGPPQTVQPVPTVATATYLQANAGLGLDVRASRDVAMRAMLSYLVQGGTNATSRLAVPFQRGPTAGVEVDWRLAPRDALATLAGGSYYAFLGDPPQSADHDAWTAQLQEAWKRSLGRGGTLLLGVGVGASGDAAGLSHLAVKDVSPTASAALDQGGLHVSAGYGPYVDFTTGLSSRRLDLFASLATPLSSTWGLVASGGAADVTTGSQHGQITASAQVVASARLLRALRAFGGVNALWQRAGPDYPAAALRQIGLVVGIDFSQGGRL